MRRRLTSRSRYRDQRGAFAVVFGLLTVMLLVISAFTVDFGQAYVSKRQLQTAADAGALAAAQVYRGQTVACATLKSDATLKAAAQKAADEWSKLNRPGGVGSTVQIGCNASGGLTVNYSVSGATPQVFGQLATGRSSITTARSAQATIDGSGGVSAGPLRPWGICSNIVSKTSNLGIVVFVPMYDSSTTSQDSASLCGNSHPPGNWWVAECLNQGQSTGETIAAVQNGCAGQSFTPVPGQTSSMTPAQLSAYLINKCPASKDSTVNCLAGDNGNNFHNASDAWQTLVGTSFTMPVFCTMAQCSPMAWDGQGSHSSYGIYRIATVTLCGFKLNPKAASTGWPTSGPCATANPRNYTSDSVTSGGGLFVVVSGLTGGPAGTDFSMISYGASSLTQ